MRDLQRLGSNGKSSELGNATEAIAVMIETREIGQIAVQDLLP